jgi:hypothetical protein
VVVVGVVGVTAVVVGGATVVIFAVVVDGGKTGNISRVSVILNDACS